MKATPSRARAGYRLEPMQLADLPDVLAIEELSFANPWPRQAFEHEVLKNPFSYPTVARPLAPERPPVAGFCIYWVLFEQIHIQNVAVHPERRGQGLGRYLLEEALAAGARAGGARAVLEVRESNRVARELYRSLGFREVGKRKGYYRTPREDAILYQKDGLAMELERGRP